MAYQPTILAFAGSSRKESFNKRLVRIAARGATRAGAKVTLIELADYPLPLFDQDAEAAAGLPHNALQLQELFLAHDGLLISAPEYNSSITPLLKNTLDWVSRATQGRPALACFAGKAALLVSASPGQLGGLRGLVHLRAILGNINVLVLPDQRAVPQAHEAFDQTGELKDPKLRESIENLGEKLAATLAKLHR